MKAQYRWGALWVLSWWGAVCQAGEPADSIGAVSLNEVEVTSQNLMHKGDHMVIIPPKEVAQTSIGIIPLLNALALPGVNVDMVNKTATIYQGSVIYQINGVEKSRNQVLSLSPRQILRIEYYDACPMRYADQEGVGGVLNFVLRDPEQGWIVQENITVTFTSPRFENSTRLQYNRDKNQWLAGYSMWSHDTRHRNIEISESYRGAQSPMIRNITTSNAPFKYLINEPYIEWSATPDSLWVIISNLSLNTLNNSGHQESVGEVTVASMRTPYTSLQEDKRSSLLPQLDLYAKRTAPNKHTFEVNMVGSYFHGTNSWLYHEDPQSHVGDYSYHIKGRRWSLTSETRYSMPLRKGRLTLGLRDKYAQNRSDYEGLLTQTSSKIFTNHFYAYASLFWPIGPVRCTVGEGLRIFSSKERELNHFTAYVTNLNVQYRPLPQLNLRLYFSYNPTSPTASQLDATLVQVDDYNATRGNPKLKVQGNYLLHLAANYSIGPFSVTWVNRMNYIKDAICGVVKYENNIYVVQQINANRYMHIFSQLDCSLNWKMGSWAWTAVGNIEINRYDSDLYRGHSLASNQFLYQLHLLACFKEKLQFQLTWEPHYTTQWGETTTYTSSKLTGAITYACHPFDFSLLGQWLGGRSFLRGTTHSPILHKSSCVRYPKMDNTICLNIGFSFATGKQIKQQRKGLSNKDSEAGMRYLGD